MRKLKYELTSNTIMKGNIILYQIKAMRSFNTVKAGEFGGYIEKESNLDQSGNAWVSDNALVYDNAEVYGNALVSDNALVYGNAEVYGNAKVSGNAWVYGNAEVYGNAKVYDNAEVSDNAKVSGNAEIYIRTHIYTCGPIGSRDGITTFYRAKGNEINVACGCFNGSIDDFEQAVITTHKGTKHEKTYLAAIKLVKIQMEVG
jgi:acyl-[acyl carrier protein]--UDP-N-acetylglucosamine O-acyltransferase